MVAKIIIGTSIRGILHYNENKVLDGDAKLILASGFGLNIEDMNFQNKLNRFNHLIELKPTVKTNALHISLNFHSSEIIDNKKMQQIAIAYMEKIGFGDQPFLVYRHNDVGHQHLHIATTSIKHDGGVIKTHNIGRDLSEPARKTIEKEFNLIVAESKKFTPHAGIAPLDAKTITYGHLPTKRAIGNVLTAVINDYKYTSLAELNALLKQFNLIADRGREETQMYQKKGLIYSILDNEGNKVGVPINSSSFYSKPTLRNLEVKFEKNKERRKVYKQDLIDRINKVVSVYASLTTNTLTIELKKEGINLVLRQNEQGRIYGVTFVDNKNKTVFNGSDLGKLYSANALVGILGSEDRIKSYLQSDKPLKSHFTLDLNNPPKTYLSSSQPTNFLNDLLGKSQSDYMPSIRKKKKRKKTF